MSHARDTCKFPYHDPVRVAADNQDGEHSHKHHWSKSCSSGHCTSVSNTKQNGAQDQEHSNTSCKATTNSYVGQFISSSHYPLRHQKMSLIRKSQLRKKYTALATSLAFAKAVPFTAVFDQ